MAQDALEAADAAPRRARQEHMASVGAHPLTGLQLPGAPEMIEPSERLEADCQDQVQALAQEILRRGAAAMAAEAASAGQGAQRPEGEAGARASRGAKQLGTMPPPPTPTRISGAPVATTGPPATTTGPQVSGGPSGPTLPTTAMRPEDRRPRGIRPPADPSVVTRSSSKVEFNVGMSRDDVIIALLEFLPNQFKEPPKVSAEFGESYAAPAEGAERTIAERFAQRILTDENLDVGFSLNQEEAGHRLRGLWRRMRQEEHERQPPYERPRPRQPPLPDPSTWAVSEEFLDEQGLAPIELEGEALGEYLANLEEAFRVWWRTTGPATNLPAHEGRLVDPKGPKTGGRWPSDNFLTAQIQTLWALERAERTFAEGVDFSEPARAWLTGQRAAHFTSLHKPSQRAPDDQGRCVRYVSLDQPVDPTPKPPERETHLSRLDDMAIVSELPHLQPKEMREMELVLRAYWQAAARESNGQEQFKGPLSVPFQALGF
jgi:hypothetical protein